MASNNSNGGSGDNLATRLISSKGFWIWVLVIIILFVWANKSPASYESAMQRIGFTRQTDYGFGIRKYTGD